MAKKLSELSHSCQNYWNCHTVKTVGTVVETVRTVIENRTVAGTAMETGETVAETVGTVGTVTETVETVRAVPVHNSYSFCNSSDRFRLPRQFLHFLRCKLLKVKDTPCCHWISCLFGFLIPSLPDVAHVQV